MQCYDKDVTISCSFVIKSIHSRDEVVVKRLSTMSDNAVQNSPLMRNEKEIWFLKVSRRVILKIQMLLNMDNNHIIMLSLYQL